MLMLEDPISFKLGFISGAEHFFLIIVNTHSEIRSSEKQIFFSSSYFSLHGVGRCFQFDSDAKRRGKRVFASLLVLALGAPDTSQHVTLSHGTHEPESPKHTSSCTAYVDIWEGTFFTRVSTFVCLKMS